MTRSRLEAQIAKIQEDLDDAIGRKAYTEAGPLQDDLEALIGKRTELPTTEELRDAVATAELAVANAAKNRDFAAAASLQSNLKDARMRLEAALEAEVESGEESNDEDSVEEQAETSIDGIESRRAELEGHIFEQVRTAYHDNAILSITWCFEQAMSDINDLTHIVVKELQVGDAK